MKKIITVFLLTLLLAACTTDVVRSSDTKITDNYFGYIAFSAMCKNTSKVFMFYDVKGLNFMRIVTQGATSSSITITCNANTPKYFLLKLPVGEYVVKGFGVENAPTEDFESVIFKVEPFKIVYLGRFYVRANLQHRDFFANSKYGYLLAYVADKSSQDIPWFLQNYKNLPKEEYVVNILNASTASPAYTKPVFS